MRRRGPEGSGPRAWRRRFNDGYGGAAEAGGVAALAPAGGRYTGRWRDQPAGRVYFCAGRTNPTYGSRVVLGADGTGVFRSLSGLAR